jgi:L-seryl-tRNA(Ser) seleniumtransferase
LPASDEKQRALRALPAVDELLRHPDIANRTPAASRAERTAALRASLQSIREEILAGNLNGQDPAALAVQKTIAILESNHLRPLRPVINATGIVLHTGLGRAVLADQAVDALTQVARGYANLELDLATGQRGHRGDAVKAKLCELTGAQAAALVNNNAAATLLILNTFADRRDAVVSRGHLIEIGGSFRLPDIMAKSGAVMREVGTTNRTRITDYQAALSDQTALLLHVHTSNYRIVGFTECPPVADLAKLAAKNNLLTYDDLGSGALFDLTTIGLPAEPNARESLAAGADLVSFSGDKLLGGPQAGIILGQKSLIQKIEKNPLFRAFRIDKFTVAALQATLTLYDHPETLTQNLPTLRMLTDPIETLDQRANALAKTLTPIVAPTKITVEPAEAYAGGGSLPAKALPTRVVIWKTPPNHCETIAAALRRNDPPILPRIHNDRVLFDCRTLRDDQIPPIVEAVKQCCLNLRKHQPNNEEAQGK